jgi:hypothetical protein
VRRAPAGATPTSHPALELRESGVGVGLASRAAALGAERVELRPQSGVGVECGVDLCGRLRLRAPDAGHAAHPTGRRGALELRRHLGHLALGERQLARLRVGLGLEHRHPLRLRRREAVGHGHGLLVAHVGREAAAPARGLELGARGLGARPHRLEPAPQVVDSQPGLHERGLHLADRGPPVGRRARRVETLRSEARSWSNNMGAGGGRERAGTRSEANRRRAVGRAAVESASAASDSSAGEPPARLVAHLAHEPLGRVAVRERGACRSPR